MKYKLRLLQDDIYQVINDFDEIKFQGTIVECNAWIELRLRGNI